MATREDGIWTVTDERSARAEIADAALCVYDCIDNGWRWVARPRVNGKLVRETLYRSVDVCSETEPYRTLEGAMDACENFYVRHWHGED